MLYNKPTRRQHYVWRYYLTPWANKDKKICCFFKSNKKTVFTSLMNIGQENDFYAFSNITFEEIKLTEALFVNAQPNKRLNTFWINAYSLIHLLKETAQQEELSKEAQIHLKDALIELEEKVYCEIERDYQGYLELLKKSDLSFLKNEEDKCRFLYLFFEQYFRTKRMKASLDRSLQGNGYNISGNNMWFLSKHILATQVGFGVYTFNPKYKYILLSNPTDIPFLTGDQAIINLEADYTKDTIPERMTMYYPLCPKLALLITIKDAVEDLSKIELTEKDVSFYNQKIISACEEQIYSCNEKSLKFYIK